MANLVKRNPQVPAVLASLVLWASFGWGLPAEPQATESEADGAPAAVTWDCDRCGTVNGASAEYCVECGAKKAGEAEAAPKDPWARVILSAAYDCAKCRQCGTKNEIRAESCWRCGYEFPQPSAEVTDPGMVFVPGRGYYKEGTMLESGKTKKGYWIAGIVLIVSGVAAGGLAGYYGGDVGGAIAALPCFAALVTGVTLFIYGVIKTKPVYAFENSELDGPFERGLCMLRPADPEGVALRVELTALSF